MKRILKVETALILLKGARSRNFSQFQHRSTAQNYRRTQTKHSKAKKGQGWTKLGWIEMDCTWVDLRNVGPPFFNLCQFLSKCHLNSWKIIFSCYAAVIFKMKDSCSANLTFRAPNKIKQNYLKQRDLAPLIAQIRVDIKRALG